MMSDILVPIIFLMILTFVFWMGWAIGKNQYHHNKIKKETPKSLEELENELEGALEIEDYETAIKINKIIHKIHLKNNKKST